MARTVSVKLLADASDFGRKMRGAGTEVKSLVGELDKANRGGHLDSLTTAATGFGLTLVGAGAGVVKFSMDFEKQMSGVRAATHASTGDMEQLRQAALKAGADTQFSATQAADGIEQLSRAGVSTADILGGGLAGALDLAAAGQLDVGEAAETAASALTQFKLKGQDVPHVADLLAAGAGKAQGSVHDLGQALNQTGLVASQTGLSIEDTTGTLAAFASAGLIGSDAGTSFKQMLLMLQAPSDKTRDLMNELGISAYDASGQFIGITGLAGQLQEKMRGLTPELRANAMAQIFGADAVRGANILYEQGATGIQAWIDKTNDAGYAAETAALKTDNLAGDVERLKGSLETLAIQSGGGANEGLRVLAKSTNALVDQFGQLPSGISGTMTVLALLGGALVLGGAGWVKYRKSTADALEELRATGPAGTRAAAALETTSKWAGRAAIAFAATQAAAAGVSAAFGNDLNPQTDALAQSLTQWATNGTKAGEATRLLGDDFQHLSYDLGTLDSGFWTGLGNGVSGFSESVSGMGSVFDESLEHAKERLSGIDGALTQMVQNGQAGQATVIFDKLATEAKKSGVNVDELKKGLPQYAAALQTAGTQSQKTATDVAQVGQTADDAEKQVQQLKDAFDALFGAQMSIDRANIKYQQGLVSLSEELKKGKRTLDDNTEEGRKNRTAVLDQIDAIKDLREARINHGASLDDANKKYVTDIDGLRKSMRQAGFTKDEVNRLTSAYRNVPGKVSTSIAQPGMANAQTEAKAYKGQLDKLTRQIKTHVSVEGDAAAYKKLEKLLVAQQAAKSGISISAAQSAFNKNAYSGGGWTGPGDMYDEAGIVHADEHVIQKKSRRRFERDHPGVLDHINATGELPPGYAAGGLVMPFRVNARNTKVMSMQDALSKVTPQFAGVGSGGTLPFIVNAVHAAFPDLRLISGYRPNSMTLTGNRSYHGMHRAGDFPPSRELAAYWNAHYKAQTKEFISPYQEYNLHNGQRHTYTGAVWRQHNFAGGNAHDHIAMRTGGVINEPVWGYGASGRSYSFGEGGISETVLPGTPQYLAPSAGPAPVTVVVQGGDGANMAATNNLLATLVNVAQGLGVDVAAALTGAVSTARSIGRTR